MYTVYSDSHGSLTVLGSAATLNAAAKLVTGAATGLIVAYKGSHCWIFVGNRFRRQFRVGRGF